MEKVLQEILTTVQAIQTDVSQLKTDVKSLDIRVGNLEKGQIELIEICRSIRDRQEETDAKVEGISMDVHELYGKVEKVDEKVSLINEDQKSVNQIVGEHEVSIRSLRRQAI